MTSLETQLAAAQACMAQAEASMAQAARSHWLSPPPHLYFVSLLERSEHQHARSLWVVILKQGGE